MRRGRGRGPGHVRQGQYALFLDDGRDQTASVWSMECHVQGREIVM